MEWKRRDWFKQLGSAFAWLALPASAAAVDKPAPLPVATVPPPDPGTIH